MKFLRQTTATAMIFALAFLGFGFVLTTDTQAQTRRTTRVNDRQVERIIASVERRSDTFRRSFDAALDRSRFDGSYTEDSVNNLVKDYETATNDLRSRFNGRTIAANDVDTVLNRAALIDQFLRTNLKQRRVQGDWTLLKGDLQRLATAYNVAFNFDGRIVAPVVTGQVPYRVSDAQVDTLLRRIETKSDTFRTSLDAALDRSRYNETRREENVNEFVKDYENSTDALRRKIGDRTSVDGDVANLLVRAARIDDFMRRNLRRETVAQRDWRTLRSELNLLSNYYGLAYNLDNRSGMPAYSEMGGVLTNADARFTGTYRLDASRSDNAQTVAANATRYIRTANRDNIYNNLVNRLTAPETLAVERQGMRVMLASTVAPQVTLDADNRERVESYPNGKQSRVRSMFSGDTLTVTSNGDRANDFAITLTSLDDGRRMLVTRSLYAESLNETVEAKSYYDRTNDRAQFNIYNNSPIYTGTNTNVNNSFYIPDNTVLVAAINNNLSTKTAKDGDRFSMIVRSPSQYAGAVIEGYVSNANRSGRVSGRSELSLNYETIRLSNNQTYRFAGVTQSVLNNSGERVQVDNEGTVEETNSQTNQTIGRTAIGTGIGAILGAILGGGKGAAIGAVVGAGAGAGSVYVQGRDDLELQNGAEFTIRASSPRAN